MGDWLDSDPPTDPSRAKAYWCEMNYFLSHTAHGDHPPCNCSVGMGHNDPDALQYDVAASEDK
jgi:hypothetical protein